MPVIRRTDAPAFTAPNGSAFTGLAAPSRGSKENSAWQLTVPAGTPGLAHSVDHEEIFILLSGRLTYLVGDDTHEVGAGDCVVVPAHTTLSVANPHAEPAQAICILPVGGKARIADGEPFTPEWAA